MADVTNIVFVTSDTGTETETDVVETTSNIIFGQVTPATTLPSNTPTGNINLFGFIFLNL